MKLFINLHFFHCAAQNKTQTFCIIHAVCSYSKLECQIVLNLPISDLLLVLLLLVVKIDRFSFSIQSWSRLLFMLKIAFLNSHKFHLLSELHTFLISNTFISKTRLKLVKIQASAKSHPEAEMLLFESYSGFSSTLSSKNATTYSEK